MVVRALPQTEIYYPDSDGKPMAESDVHRKLLLDLDFALRYHFRDDPNTYAAANMLMYFVEGDPTQSVAPDVFIVKGVPKHDRRSYKVWEETKAPDVIIELTSASTRREDLGTKRELYEELGVQEYFLFDPFGEYLKPPLRGYRLVGGAYVSIEGEPIKSEILGLELRVEGQRLRLYDPLRQKFVPTPEEWEDRAEQAEMRARQAEMRAEQAEMRAAQAEARARQEAEARQALEAELARLRAEIEKGHD